MRTLRRVLLAALLAGSWLLATAPAGSAHGGLLRADPPAGTALEHSPGMLRLTFSEAPDRALSSVRVLDAGGRLVGGDRTALAPDDPATLQTRLAQLADGTYTVSWRIVSSVDGHSTSGAFTFGVGVAAPAVQAAAVAEQTEAAPGPLAVAGRLAFFSGLALLVGAAATGLVVFGRRLSGPRTLLVVSLVAGAAGLAAMTVATWRQAAVPLGQLLASDTGRWLAWRGIALLVAAVATAAVAFRPARALSLAALGVAAAGGLLVHALAGHAAAPSSMRWLHLATQWAHLVMVGVWIGGLAWLLTGMRGRGRRQRVQAALRYSHLATISLVAVVGTGLLRTLDELDGWRALLGTGFGRVLLVKLALFALLLLLGAVNHFQVVPGLRSGRLPVGSLRRTVRAELGLSAAIVLSAALLGGLAPRPGAASLAGQPEPALVQTAGADYTTSVRVTLTVSPGTAGPNRFIADVADFDTGLPAVVERVRLACSMPERPDVGSFDLDLARGQDGRWAASGSALPVAGGWDVTALVEGGTGALTVPLHVRMTDPGTVQDR
jgi:copper transport protein